MIKHRIRHFFLTVLLGAAVAAGGLAQDGPAPSSGSITMFDQAATARQRAVFAVFIASIPAASFDTTFSLTNTLAGPPGIQETFDQRFHDLVGTIEFFLWDEFGHLLTYETQMGSPGAGLNDEGQLEPGRTYRVLLSEILAEAGYPQRAMELGHSENFIGYGWIVANFDGVQGTANVTDFSTFNQSIVLQPDLGTTFWDFDANAGVPIIPPSEEPPPSG